MKDVAIRVYPDLSYGPHGVRNQLDLYLPEDRRPRRPLLVCIHGGGWAGGSKEAFGWMGVDLARRGIAVATVNYRFAPQWHWPTQLDDVQRAVRWLRSRARMYRLDPERMGALGGSAGGHLAAFLGLPDRAGRPCRVSCVVDCYGPVDLVAMMDSASAPIIETFLGRPLAKAEALCREASPYWQVRPTPAALLIVHGTNDTGEQRGQVPIGISRRFCAKLRRAGVDARFVALKGAPHGFTGAPASVYAKRAWKVIVPFVRKHLAAGR